MFSSRSKKIIFFLEARATCKNIFSRIIREISFDLIMYLALQKMVFINKEKDLPTFIECKYCFFYSYFHNYFHVSQMYNPSWFIPYPTDTPRAHTHHMRIAQGLSVSLCVCRLQLIRLRCSVHIHDTWLVYVVGKAVSDDTNIGHLVTLTWPFWPPDGTVTDVVLQKDIW